MNTSPLSYSAPLVVLPALSPPHSLVSGALHLVQALLMPVLKIRESSERAYHRVSLPAKPLLFSGKGIYTPHQDWNGYR